MELICMLHNMHNIMTSRCNLSLPFSVSSQIPFLSHIRGRVRAGFAAEVLPRSIQNKYENILPQPQPLSPPIPET